MTQSPCIDCKPPKRFPGCHMTCKDGIEYDQEEAAKRAQIKAVRHQEDEFTMYRYDKDYQPKTRARGGD